MTMNYDSIIITLILVVDSGLLILAYLERRNRLKARNSRKFNKILQSIGLK